MSALCDEIEKMGKGIGNANRFRVFESLMRGSRTVSEITARVELPQPAVSQHLKVLKSSNLVESERQGKEIYYSINVAYMAKLLHKLAIGVKRSPA